MSALHFPRATADLASFAGSDTTATSIRALLLHIITNPLVYAKVQAEIYAAVTSGELSARVSTSKLAH